jgi:hypothetical protein
MNEKQQKTCRQIANNFAFNLGLHLDDPSLDFRAVVKQMRWTADLIEAEMIAAPLDKLKAPSA